MRNILWFILSNSIYLIFQIATWCKRGDSGHQWANGLLWNGQRRKKKTSIREWMLQSSGKSTVPMQQSASTSPALMYFKWALFIVRMFLSVYCKVIMLFMTKGHHWCPTLLSIATDLCLRKDIIINEGADMHRKGFRWDLYETLNCRISLLYPSCFVEKTRAFIHQKLSKI